MEGLNNRLRQINAELMKRGTVEVPCLLTAPVTYPWFHAAWLAEH